MTDRLGFTIFSHMLEIWNDIKLNLNTQVADHGPSLAVLESLQFLGMNHEIENGRLRLGLPSSLSIDMAERKLRPLIEKQIKNLIDHKNLGVEFVLSQKSIKPTSPQMELGAAPEAEIKEPLYKFLPKFSLNKDMTIENFVKGPQSSFAVECLKIFADPNSVNLGPLLIYGHSGLGKTHLLHSLGWQILGTNPEIRIKYVTGEEFINDYHSDISRKQMSEFRGKYRLKTDLLLIDDIHSIGRTKGAQEELFNILNYYAATNKMIAFTCDKSPDQLTDFEDRLKSRLQGGLSAEITMPEFETRFSIAVQKTLQFGLSLSPVLLEFLAQNIDQDLRALTGAIYKLGVMTNVSGREPDLQSVEKALNLSAAPVLNVSIDSILASTALKHNLKISDLKSTSRFRIVLNARNEAMRSLRDSLGLSYSEIGRVFGKDHSTVMNSLKTSP